MADRVLALEGAGFPGAPISPPPRNCFSDSAFWYSLVTGVGVVELRVHLLLSLPITFPVRPTGNYESTEFLKVVNLVFYKPIMFLRSG